MDKGNTLIQNDLLSAIRFHINYIIASFCAEIF